MPDLTLYYMPTCPFCRKVLAFMGENNIEIPLKDTAENNDNAKELISIGGKPQVPCLAIDGKPLFESDAIIEWLGNNYTAQ